MLSKVKLPPAEIQLCYLVSFIHTLCMVLSRPYLRVRISPAVLLVSIALSVTQILAFGDVLIGKHADIANAILRFVDRIYVQNSQTNPISWK